jgi:hypothetical protein
MIFVKISPAFIFLCVPMQMHVFVYNFIIARECEQVKLYTVIFFSEKENKERKKISDRARAGVGKRAAKEGLKRVK